MGVWASRSLTVLSVVALGVPILLVGADRASALDVTVSATGRAVYTDADGMTKPIPFAKVELCDDDTPFGDCDLMDSGRTGADGTFSLRGTAGDLLGPPDVYVRVIAQSAAGNVQLETGIGFLNYCMASTKVDNWDTATDGSTLALGDISAANTTGCAFFAPHASVDDTHAAWQLHTWLYDVFDWTRDNLVTPGPTSLIWPSTLNGVPFYNPLPPTIRFTPGFEDSRRTVFHEYGHHVLYSFAESPLPNYSNDTCDETNPLAFLPPFGGHCFWEQEQGEIHWTEGFPEFFSLVVEDQLDSPAEPRLYHAHDNETVVSIETPYDAEGNPASPSGQSRKRIEGWTAAILWDLYDSNDDNHDAATDRTDSGDRLDLSMQQIWAAVQTDPDPLNIFHDHPTKIEEFQEVLNSLYPNLENRVNAIYAENGVGSNGTDLATRDLVIDGPTSAYRGETVEAIDATLVNPDSVVGTGENSTTTFQIQYQFGNDWVEIGSRSVPALGPGGVDLARTTLTIPDVRPGTYHFRACADGVREIYETRSPDDTILSNCTDGPDIEILNHPPTGTAGGPYEFDEGSFGVLTGTGSDLDGDPVSFDWYSPSGIVGPPTNESTVTVNRSADDGTYNVELDLHDGYVETKLSTTVRINNVAPAVQVTNVPSAGFYSVFEGSTLTVEGQLRDPGPDEWESEAFFDGDLDWTAGTIVSTEYDTVIRPPANVARFEIEKSFPDETSGKGTDFIVCGNDDDGGSACTPAGVLVVRVFNVAPSVTLPAGVTADEGTQFELSGSFADPGTDSWTGTASVDGGTPVAVDLDPAAKTFSVDLTIPQDGLSSVEVCIGDGTAETCETTSVTVSNVAPTVSINSVPDSFLIYIEDSISAVFGDPGALDTHVAAVNWGDGSSDAFDPAGNPVSGSHVFDSSGPTTIEVCVTDDGGGVGCASAVVDVISPGELLELVEEELAGDVDDDAAVGRALRKVREALPFPAPEDLATFDTQSLVVALSDLRVAVRRLDKASTDQSDAQMTLALVAEASVLDLFARVESEVPVTPDRMMLIDRAEQSIIDGQANAAAGNFEEAIEDDRSAAQRLEEVLDDAYG